MPKTFPFLVAAAALCLGSCADRLPAQEVKPGTPTREPHNQPDTSSHPSLYKCRSIVGGSSWDVSAASTLRAIIHDDSGNVTARALNIARTLPDVATFEALETRACQLMGHGISSDEYMAFIDSVVPVVLTVHGDSAISGSAPELIAPQSGIRFDLYPRETTVSWHSEQSVDHYLLEVQVLTRGYKRLPSGDVVKVGYRWFPHNDGLSSAVVRDTVATFYFVGAQPGRWRVRGIFADGRSTPPSAWRTFLYQK